MTPIDPEAQEQARLAALRALTLLDTASEPELDRITTLAANVMGMPICLVSLVDANRLWFKSRCGINESQYPATEGICLQVVAEQSTMVCPDLSLDPRFMAHPIAQNQACGPAVRFYAGAPLRVDGQQVIGTLCVMSHEARPDFDAAKQALLEGFARVVEDTVRASQQRAQIQRERTLFADGPVAAVIWDKGPTYNRMIYHSMNLGAVIGAELHARLEKGEAFDSLIWREDASMYRTALQSHALSRLLNLETTKERLFLALESTQIGTWDLNAKTMERLVNARTAAMLGYRPDELDINQSRGTSMVHPFDRAPLSESTKARLAQKVDSTTGDPFALQYRIRHKKGHYIWVQSSGKLVSRDDAGQPERIVGTIMDVTEAKTAALLCARQQTVLDLVNSTQRTFLIDKSLDAACARLFEPLLKLTESQFGFIGLVRHDEQGQLFLHVPSISNISWDEDSRAWYDRHMLDQGGLHFTKLHNLFGHVVTHDTVVCSNDITSHAASRGTPRGHPALDSFLGLPLRFNGQVVGMIGLGNRNEGFSQDLVDLLEPLTTTLGTLIHARELEVRRVRAEEQLFQQATQDGLTGLNNRRRFFEIAEEFVAQSRRYGTPMTIALMDLDNFKQVNDEHGHAAGDAVIKAFAGILTSDIRDTDRAARVGGEEFALIMPSTTQEEALVALKRILQHTADMVVQTHGKSLHFTVSIGACQWNEALTSPDQWLLLADQALYRAKNEGRNQIVLNGEGVASEQPPAAPVDSTT